MGIENRGFASLSVERRKEIARLGGQKSRGGGRKRKVDKQPSEAESAERSPSPESGESIP